MTQNIEQQINELSAFVTPRRKALFDSVLDQRTTYLTVVLEDIYQPHNASAALRTCECFGIQDVHIIENRNRYTLNPDVLLGSDKWLNLIRYREKDFNTPDAIKHLRGSGYRLVATSPVENATPLEEYDLNKGKTALFFGTELTGLTGDVLEQADENIRIPIVGFTGSYNISVSVAIILYQLRSQLQKSRIKWDLEREEKDRILLEWLRKSR